MELGDDCMRSILAKCDAKTAANVLQTHKHAQTWCKDNWELYLALEAELASFRMHLITQVQASLEPGKVTNLGSPQIRPLIDAYALEKKRLERFREWSWRRISLTLGGDDSGYAVPD